MRFLKLACIAFLAVAFMPAVSEARSRWSVSFGYSSGNCYRGSGLSIGYGYSYGYRPSFVHGYSGYSRGYCPPTYYRPVYYAPRPVYYSSPTYCAPTYQPPVYYRTPSFYRDCDYGYSAPVYYSTPRFRDNYSYVSVNYSSGYRHNYNYRTYDRGYNYVDRGYSYCQPSRSYGYSSYYRR